MVNSLKPSRQEVDLVASAGLPLQLSELPRPLALLLVAVAWEVHSEAHLSSSNSKGGLETRLSAHTR